MKRTLLITITITLITGASVLHYQYLKNKDKQRDIAVSKILHECKVKADAAHLKNMKILEDIAKRRSELENNGKRK